MLQACSSYLGFADSLLPQSIGKVPGAVGWVGLQRSSVACAPRGVGGSGGFSISVLRTRVFIWRKCIIAVDDISMDYVCAKGSLEAHGYLNPYEKNKYDGSDMTPRFSCLVGPAAQHGYFQCNMRSSCSHSYRHLKLNSEDIPAVMVQGIYFCRGCW